MSEYQYYEFQTVDRPLSAEQHDYLRSLSRRVELTATSAVFNYSYGSFPGEPLRVLEEHFDVLLYIANWGSKQLAFRFPRASTDPQLLQTYLPLEETELTTTAQYTLINIGFHEEEPLGWIEGEGFLMPMIPLREDILRGDYRMLYLAWLKAAEYNEAIFEEEGKKLIEPPVPPGLGEFSPALQAFRAFFDIDQDLVAAAAEASPPLQVTAEPLERWIALLPIAERNAFLLRVAQGETHVGIELLRRLREVGGAGHGPALANTPRRNFAALKNASHEQQKRRIQREKEEAERARLAKLKSLAQRETEVWAQVENLLAKRTASGYDEAVSQLTNLRDLAQHQKQTVQFEKNLARVLALYANSVALKRRLVQAGLNGL